MYFLILGRDGTDKEAPLRREKAREAHLKRAEKAASSGALLYGGALTDENEDMCGSMLVCSFPDRDTLNEWIAEEPYISNHVWKDIEITTLSILPTFLK